MRNNLFGNSNWQEKEKENSDARQSAYYTIFINYSIITGC